MNRISIVVFAGFALGPLTAAFGQTEKVVYSFGPDSAGTQPFVGVIDVKGTFYGTTYDDRGVLYSLDPKTGQENLAWLFGNGADGYNPSAPVIEVNGTLYGTTMDGGAHCRDVGGCGTVFAFDLESETERVVYSFGGGSADGMNPVVGLTFAKGRLYGTTPLDGSHYEGTAFSVDTKTGKEKILYSFCSLQNCADGAYPNTSLIDVNGILYGTTPSGGTANLGTVFSIDPATGAETVLHSFGGGADGEDPGGGLTLVNGTLYGTTQYGGNFNNSFCGTDGSSLSGCGTVFALNPQTGAEAVVYSFCSLQNCTDGRNPSAGLTEMGGRLYGTTSEGGSNNNSLCGPQGIGCGTAFAVNLKTGGENVVYSFCGLESCADGLNPGSTLLARGGRLYGTTYQGGIYTYYGTVFELKP